MKKLSLLKSALLLCALVVGSLNGWAYDVYGLVTDASTLKPGDKLIIVSESKGKVACDISSSQVMAETNISVNTSTHKTTAALSEDAIVLTLGGKSGSWTLTNSSSKKLGATAVKKLAWDSGTQTWSISIASGGNATIQNGTNTYGRFLHNVNSTRFTTYTSATSSIMLLPQIYRLEKADITPAKTFTTNVSVTSLDFTSTDKLTAYIATAASGNSVTLTSVDKVPAGTPIVVKATQTGSAISVDYAATTDDVSGNKLLAGDGTTEIGGDGKYDYILKDGLFCRVKTASALAAGKCYLHLDSAPTGANELTIDFEDGGVTGIQTVESQKSLFDGDFYNLAGQKVQNPTRGLYIVNGKKVIIK